MREQVIGGSFGWCAPSRVGDLRRGFNLSNRGPPLRHLRMPLDKDCGGGSAGSQNGSIRRNWNSPTWISWIQPGLANFLSPFHLAVPRARTITPPVDRSRFTDIRGNEDRCCCCHLLKSNLSDFSHII